MGTSFKLKNEPKSICSLRCERRNHRRSFGKRSRILAQNHAANSDVRFDAQEDFNQEQRQGRMKLKPLISHLAFVAFVFILTGCANLSQSQQSRLQSAATLAAYVGTVEVLREHPEHRPGFVFAVEELTLLESGSVDAFKLMEIVNRLPVKELRSEHVSMIIGAATILLTDQIGTTPLEKLDDLKPVIAAIRSGIEHGLNQ